MSCLLLLVNKPGLLGFLFFLDIDSILNLLFLVITVGTHCCQMLSMGFLANSLLLHSKGLAALTLLVLELRFDDVAGAPLRLLDLLPRLHFLLLEERDSVGEQLRVLLDAIQ